MRSKANVSIRAIEKKYRVQALLSKESASVREYLISVREYLINAHRTAEEVAKLYGFRLNYVEIPNTPIQRVKL